MELQEFVRETLVEISKGVEAAQLGLSDSDAEIHPVMKEIFTKTQSGGTNQILGIAKGNGLVTMVEFDLAVTVTEGKGTKGGIGVLAAGLGLGSQGRSEEARSEISRIQFKVPLKLPRKNRD